MTPPTERRFPTARDDKAHSEKTADTPQTRSHAYRLSFVDQDFMLREELRPVRLQLELLKPELLQEEQGVHSTIVLFGSARIPAPEDAEAHIARAAAATADDPDDKTLARDLTAARRLAAKSRYYDDARKLARLISTSCQKTSRCDLVVITGGGPGIMEAGNRGAFEASAKSVGLNIVLPHEQAPNRYITPDLSFQFHYFAIRKMHFLMRARALVAFPGGFGTLDELFEALTLIQTKKIKPVPVILYGSEFWKRLIDFDYLVEEGTISARDLELFRFVDDVDEAWRIIAEAEDLQG